MAEQTDKDLQSVDEINISDVDWNKLSVNQFHQVEKQLQEKRKLLKSNQKTVRVSGSVNVKIKGKVYHIRKVLYNRLAAMKSQKSKDKLIEEIVSNHNPVEEF